MSLVEIEFKGRRKGIYVSPQDLSLKRDDLVIVSADRGEDFGRVTLVGEEWQETLTRMQHLLDGGSPSSDNSNGNGNGKGNGKHNGNGNEAAIAESKTDHAPSPPPPLAESTNKPDSAAGEEPDTTEDTSGEVPADEPAEPVEEDAESPFDELPEVLRLASDEDRDQEEKNRTAEHEARSFFFKEVKRLNLEMKLVDIEYQLDRKKLTFYFTADGRVDFRELVKSLAQNFHTRIDLRQIGARDESKRIGGIGICGRELCCATWIREFKPVTTSMLKEQGLLMNPQKNTGLCGKLRCCLRYEVDQYREVNRLFPKEGIRVRGPRGEGVIEKVSMCHSSLGVKWEDGQRIGYSFDQVRNFTDWNPEKKDETKVVLFREDPSIAAQEREEREGRLITSFEYEEKTDNDLERKNRRKSRRNPRDRRGHRKEKNAAKGQSDQQTKSSDAAKEQDSRSDRKDRHSSRRNRNARGRRNRTPENGSNVSTSQNGQETTTSQQKQSKEDRNERSRSRGGRGNRRHASNKSKQHKTSGEQRQNSQQNASGSNSAHNTKNNSSSQQSNGKNSNQTPKGQPVHPRGHRRRR